MKPDVLLELLETTAESLGVKVSYESLQASIGVAARASLGGLCRVKGEYRVIVDKRATPQERVATLAAALATIATAEPTEFWDAQPAKVREALEMYAAKKAS